MTNKKTKQKKVKNVDTPTGQIFIGCMFLGVAVGFLIGYITAGALFGMGIGFIIKGILDGRKK